MILKEELQTYITIDKYTGEKVRFVRKVCKCGHSISFLKNIPVICRRCGRKVYPTNICEFREKMKKELRKNK